MAEYLVVAEPFIADCNGSPVPVLADDIVLLEGPELNTSGKLRFKHEGKLCTMSADDFLNAVSHIEVGDRFVASWVGFSVTVERSDDGWRAGVMEASGARWLRKEKTSDPETGKKQAAEMLADLAKIALRQQPRWKYRSSGWAP